MEPCYITNAIHKDLSVAAVPERYRQRAMGMSSNRLVTDQLNNDNEIRRLNIYLESR